MQPTLPTGFQSWTQVLTHWSVSRAFDASPRPSCFSAQPELAAPFVDEISAFIRAKQLRSSTKLAVVCEAATEPAFDRAGGPAYLELRRTLENAQSGWFDRRSSPEAGSCRAEVERLQLSFLAIRQRHADQVRQARAAAARAYWSAHPPHGISDDFFSSAAPHTIPARMGRIDPSWWWRSFFTRLQIEFANRHPAEGVFLDALPALRAQARRKTLAGVISEWSDAHRATLGWNGPGHYRMLSIRAEKKARSTAGWFDTRAPGYLGNDSARRALQQSLAELLAQHDPLPRLLSGYLPDSSAHGPN